MLMNQLQRFAFLTCVLLNHFQCTAGLFEQWRWVSPKPQGNPLLGLTVHKTGFVAVGFSGTIVLSTNGTDWRMLESGTSSHLYGIASSGKTLVARGWATLASEDDGTSWRRVGTNLPPYDAVVWGNGIFVTAGGGVNGQGGIWSSTNGISWVRTHQLNQGSDDVISFAYGNGRFVGVTLFGRVCISTNGTNWSEQGAFPRLLRITFGGGKFVGYDRVSFGDSIYSSTNGVAWVNHYTTSFQSSDVAFANGRVVLVAPGFTSTSTNWQTWANQFPFPASLYAVVGTSNLFVTVGNGGAIFTSTNGFDWQSRMQSPLGSQNAGYSSTAVAYGQDRFIVPTTYLGGPGPYLASTNGSDWSVHEWPEPSAVRDVIFAGGRFVAVGPGPVFVSTNATQWQSRQLPVADNLGGITYGNGRYVAVGSGGSAYRSSDAATWTTHPVGSSMNDVAYGNGRFVAVGDNGRRATSLDGASWTLGFPPASPHLFGIAYGQGVFVAVGEAGRILTTVDFATWETRSAPTTGRLNDVGYAAGTFVAVGYDVDGQGIILTSTNGIAWAAHESHAYQNLEAITFALNRFFVVGSGGTILASDVPRPILGLTWASTSGAAISVAGPAGFTYDIEYSERISSGWLPFARIVSGANPTQVADAASTNANRRFYRAVAPP